MLKIKPIRLIFEVSCHVVEFNSEKTLKRHQLSMTFPCALFNVFSASFGLNFEDEGATYDFL